MRLGRPQVTYSRRKAKQNFADGTSSPLQELSPSKQDVSLSEMSRRMKKRSRQVLCSNDEVPQQSTAEHMSKKVKHVPEAPGCTAAQEAVPRTPVVPHHHPIFPLGTQQINDSIFETPVSFVSDETLIKPYAETLAPMQFSPLPVARRMLSRTSSHNLKENPSANSRRELASPFNSRPGSRASSPFRAPKRTPARPISHTKSRTLSTSLAKQHNKTINFDQTPDLRQSNDSLFDSSYNISAPSTMYQTTGHSRTASIPTMSSALLDNISSHDWLVPPKALSRSPPSYEDMQLDAFQAEHESFYFDTPAKISTPARKRSATITYNNFRSKDPETTALDSATSSPDDVLMADTVSPDSECPRRPRRRRRTIVHMTSDSIFSSALDFSSYTSENSPTKVHQRFLDNQPSDGMQNVQLPTSALPPSSDLSAALVLDPAFSPAPVSAVATQSTNSGKNAPVTIHSGSVIAPTPEQYSLKTTRSLSLPETPSAGGDELRDMFTMLEIDADPLLDVADANDSGIGLGKIRSPMLSAHPRRTKEQTHRRKRGDTIRASDFPQPSVRPTVSFDGVVARPLSDAISTECPLPRPQIMTRRTRSGTVTLANADVQHSIAKPSTGRRSQLRKPMRVNNGRPGIMMKIDDDPLPPQGSDSEDDELLLTGEMWKD